MIFETKRSESDIIYKILSETKEGIKKTQLMYNANMSNTQLNRYLDILIEKDFIEKRNDNGGRLYHLTSKGKKLYDPLQQVLEILDKDKRKY
jgi:predicted transcriptional regulator